MRASRLQKVVGAIIVVSFLLVAAIQGTIQGDGGHNPKAVISAYSYVGIFYAVLGFSLMLYSARETIPVQRKKLGIEGEGEIRINTLKHENISQVGIVIIIIGFISQFIAIAIESSHI